jgi:glycosyltransferase involved in cell wall biosynthesis
MAGSDVAHLLIEPYAPLAARAVPPAVPLVATAHGTYAVRPLQRLATRALQARALRRVDLLVCQSAATRDAVAALVPLPPHVVLPGGVAIDDAGDAGAGSLDGLVEPGLPVILTVGAIKRRKGHDHALAALARAATPERPLCWVVVGDATGDPVWAATLAAQGAKVADRLRVRWRGRVTETELGAWYRRADVLVHLPADAPDAFEGLGLVLLEAAAHGVPAVTWTGSGAAEAVIDGETGIVVARGGVAAAGDAVRRLAWDGAARARLGAGARTFARSRSWTALAGALVGHYQRLIGARRSGRTSSRDGRG